MLVAVSSHGFGHLAQVAPVLNVLDQDHQSIGTTPLELILRTSLAHQQIASRVHANFAVDAGSDDFGMVMHDALRVDLVSSLNRYAQLHANWNMHIDDLAKHLEMLDLDSVLADVPYLTLAAAKAANIPSAGICSLNWADILEQCVRHDPAALQEANVSTHTLQQILREMRDAYGSAGTVLAPAPAIKTTGFSTQTIDPIAPPPSVPNRASVMSFIRAQRPEFESLADNDCWIVLTSMGGIELALQTEHWPTHVLGKPVIYLLDRLQPNREPHQHPQSHQSHQPHALAFDLSVLSFQTLMASCDLVLTKPGYGMFVETSSVGKPMIYLAREQWPETPWLIDWAHEHLAAHQISLTQIAQGDFEDELSALLQTSKITPKRWTGARQAADTIGQVLLGYDASH